MNDTNFERRDEMGSVTYNTTDSFYVNPSLYTTTTGNLVRVNDGTFTLADPEQHKLVVKESGSELDKMHKKGMEMDKSKNTSKISSDKIVSGTVKVVPTIEKVIFNPPATIVIWSDGLKTVVKAKQKGKKKDKFSEEFGLAMAISKRYFCGNRSQFLKAVKEAKRFE